MDDNPASRAHWMHELRNSLGLVGINMRLSARLMEKGRWDEAQATLLDGLQAWERCREQLSDSPQPVAPARGDEGTQHPAR